MAGCEVVVTITGEQAVEAAKTLRPHMVIVDLNMPGMDGFDTLAALKLLPLSDGTVYVAHTASNDTALLAKVRQAGFQHFILKTSGFETFETLLSSIQGPPAS
jgi:CheY-like chemotaxis protein